MAKILAIAALVGLIVGGWIGYKVSQHQNHTEITELKATIATMAVDKTLADELAARNKAYYEAVDMASAERDARIAELSEQVESHKAATAIATAAAREASARLQRSAATVLASRPPPGADICVAAQSAFDNELRIERREKKP